MTTQHTSQRPSARGRRLVWVVAALLLQCALVALCVAPQVSARVLGTDYRLRVAPVDPIEPFRGAYVALTYPDLPTSPARGATGPITPNRGEVYVPLIRDGDVWRGAAVAATDRPTSGPYLACVDNGRQLQCGIDSWFAPQDEAARLETAVRGGQAIAVVRVDDRGNAALVELVSP